MSRPPLAARLVRGTALAVAAALTLAACGSGGDESGGDGSVVNYALPANATPNWILPIGVPGTLATHNISIYKSLWPSLVAFNGSTGEVALDEAASVAESIRWSGDGTQVTLALKAMSWSDGQPVTSRDVEFWFNLIKAGKDGWASYAEGKMPDNVTAVETPDPSTVVLTLDQAYNQQWFTSTQLTLITPLPHHAWAKTSDDGAVGDGDRDPAQARQIFDYLVAEAEDLASYETNPLWDVVSGPFTAAEYAANGQVKLVRNQSYDGTDPARADEVNLLPFTSADAEVNAVRAKSVDYGYISSSALAQEQQYTGLGYRVEPWTGWSVTYMPYNFHHPQMGAVFSQLYVRQALQHAVDQVGISDVVWHGAADPGYGPVPQEPASDYLSEVQANNPYPFDLAAATQLFTAHGWTPGPDGVLACTNPGSGPDQCGEGVAAGTRMELTFLVQSGSQETDNQFAEIQSALQQVGVGVYLEQAPLNQVLSRTVPCEAGDPECTWQLSYFGTAGSWYFGAYPTGERIFGTGGTANFGSYSNPEADALLSAAVLSNEQGTMAQYSALLAQDLPVMWLPNPVYQVSVIAEGLTGTTQDPGANFYPQRWGWES
ncbi:peptide ABC transporter substrate-binding protein [Pseudonocardia kunmingensis]|uniref:Peptide/nickel transport system substrate-binding protein n=1 Tax=Pseudonocardia kunmingensis TaxID=630975 RepID=A0A543DIV9_9PSEU|nr:peptide ABC transporter substrate-binding protein [Pseudonocardia kunmingensis]TQM09260.1 peptide/nickel transport system substrate-binding protein [Pseudonocardia kunmingensis]